jgi:hypothetical protein
MATMTGLSRSELHKFKTIGLLAFLFHILFDLFTFSSSKLIFINIGYLSLSIIKTLFRYQLADPTKLINSKSKNATHNAKTKR